MSHKKFGPHRFSRFDVYWIQTDRQTDKQTDKPNLYIDLWNSPFFHFFAKTFLLTGGRLAELFGGKWLFGGGVFITAVFTLLTPLVNLPVDNQLLNLFFIYI